MNRSAELRARADSIRKRLRAQPLERLMFVEFSGTPKSGKSTCIDIVTHCYSRSRTVTRLQPGANAKVFEAEPTGNGG